MTCAPLKIPVAFTCVACCSCWPIKAAKIYQNETLSDEITLEKGARDRDVPCRPSCLPVVIELLRYGTRNVNGYQNWQTMNKKLNLFTDDLLIHLY